MTYWSAAVFVSCVCSGSIWRTRSSDVFDRFFPELSVVSCPVCNVHVRPSYLHGVWRLSLDKRKRVGGDLWLKARVPDLCGLASAKRRRPQKNIFHKLSTRSQVFSDSPRTAFACEVTASSVAQQVLQLYAAASMWRVADELPSEHPPILGYTWQRL